MALVDIVRAVRPEVVADEAALEACVAAAAAACPGVTVTAERFVHALAERLPPGAAIGGVATVDLYLACACGDGDPAALALFEARYARVIERAVAAAGAPPADRADLVQVVRQRIFVETGGKPPRIASYSGKGPLAAWLRVIASREVARSRVRATPMAADPDEELALRIAPDDPELDYVKRRYRAEFAQAFQAAVEGLDSRHRLVLRQYTLDGLGIDELAALHRIHRATAARWVANAREAVLNGTQDALTAKLQLSPDELDSLLRLVRSQLDVSLPRLLATTRGS